MKRNLEEIVTLAHGGGGLMTRALIEDVFLRRLSNNILSQLGDSAVLEPVSSEKDKFAFTIDSYVVKPLFFRGGDIGRLAVCGTVNDLAMAGARPLYLSLSLIIEEGYPVAELSRVTESVHAAACEAGVLIVAGDTKVVEKGAADGLYITTAGLGIIPERITVDPNLIQIGDVIIVNGFLGDHGVAILHEREQLMSSSNVSSDVAPLSGLIQAVLAVCPDIHFMRDLTRGGLAAALNEVCISSRKAVEVDEAEIPLGGEVLATCNLYGIDPLTLANEGKCIIICPAPVSNAVLQVMQSHEYGRNSRIIGKVINYKRTIVIGRTGIGGTRIIPMPSGRILPRIC